MSEPLLIRVTDDRLTVGDRDLPRPKKLDPGRFADRMKTWLAPHEETEDQKERAGRRDAVSPQFLQKFGRALFDALLGGGKAYSAYKASGDAPIALDLPEDLHTLPWELMHDGELWVAQDRGLVRLAEGPPQADPGDRAGPLRVLALMAAPVLNPTLGAGDEGQPYVGDVESYAAVFHALHGESFPAAFTIIRHATLDDLRVGLEKGADVLYFDGHGSANGILFDDGFGRTRGLDRYTVRQRLHGSGVRLAITNSCLTASQATGECPVAGMLVWAGVPVVVGMQLPIGVVAAASLAEAFLGALARGRLPAEAVASGRAALQDAHNPRAIGDERWQQVQAWEWATPAVYVAQGALAELDRPLASEDSGTAVVLDGARDRLAAEPGAGSALPQRPARFVGRRQELVDIAESLSQTRVTTLYGVRGVGKTTLAQEAVRRSARRFQRIVWVRARVESPADVLAEASADPVSGSPLRAPGELLDRVAAGLALPEGLAEADQRAAISRELAQKPTLLVLDNLDSFAEGREFAASSVLRDLLAVLPDAARALLTVAGDLPFGRPIHVVGLPLKAAALLAQAYAREMGVDLPAEDAGLIGATTGGHPMAIRFAVGLLARSATRQHVLDGLRGMHGKTVDEVLSYVMGRAVQEASADARLLFKLAGMFPSPILRDVLEAGTLWDDHNRFRKALDQAVDLVLLEVVYSGEWVLIQELPRAEAARLEFELPRGPEHGKAMVDWARRHSYEALFCGLVAAWSSYCQPRGHLAIWEPAGREAVRLARHTDDRRRERIALNDLGVWCGRTGKPKEALQHLSRCAALAHDHKDELAEATALGNMGLIYADQGELDRALESYQKAYDIGKRLNDPKAMAATSGNMGSVYFRQGELDRALASHQMSYDIGERLNDPHVMASALVNMGLTYAAHGDLDRALEAYQMSYDIAERLNDPRTMASALGNMGLIYASQGELDRALECHRTAYEIAERLNDPHVIAGALGNMGLIYAAQGELDRALESHQKAYAIGQRLNNPQTMANQLGNMGSIYRRQGELDRALDSYQKAYDIGQRLNNPQTMANQLGKMGLIYRRRGELDRALESYQKAYDIAERLNNPETMANALGNMGNVFAEQGELDRALESHRKAYEIDVTLNNPQGQAEDLGNMGLIHRRKGELDRALQLFHQAYDIGEGLHNPEVTASMLGNMGLVYLQQANLAKAKDHIERAKAIFERVGLKPLVEQVAGHLERIAQLEEIEKQAGPDAVRTLLDEMRKRAAAPQDDSKGDAPDEENQKT